MAKKLVVELEIPEGISLGEEEIRLIQSSARRALLYLFLEKKQKREPTRQELERLARETKRGIYKRIAEAER